MFSRYCQSVCFFELKNIKIFDLSKFLSDIEFAKFKKLGKKRKISYLGARFACKIISQKLSKIKIDFNLINTIMPDLTRPCCPIDNDINKIFCSVSHDSRFVIVVVSQNNIGIDVEEISNKIINLKRYFINDFDNLDSNLSQKEVFTKIWTIKEAVSKAFDINLAKSWQKVFVKKIGLKKSIFEFDKKDYFAIHEILDNHIFTLVKILK